MCNFTREIKNSRRENIWVITCFWGASGLSDSLAPRASGCHSPMSRPACLLNTTTITNCFEGQRRSGLYPVFPTREQATFTDTTIPFFPHKSYNFKRSHNGTTTTVILLPIYSTLSWCRMEGGLEDCCKCVTPHAHAQCGDRYALQRISGSITRCKRSLRGRLDGFKNRARN